MFDGAPPLHCTFDCRHRAQEFGRSLETLRRVFFQEYLQKSYDRLRNVSQLIYRRCGVLMLVDQPRSGALERDLASQHLPERDSERIKVRTNICSYTCELLWAGILGCSSKGSLGRNCRNRVVLNCTFG